MPKLVTTVLFLSISFYIQAQWENYKGIRVHLRQTVNKNSSAAEFEGVGFFGFGMDVQNGNYENNLQFTYRNRIIGDFVSMIIPGNIDKIATKGTEISTGILGWWNVGYNLYQTDKLNIAPAIALHDYIYSSGDVEPNGYYFTIGPAFIADYELSDPFILHFEGSYCLSNRARAQSSKLGDNYDPNARDPHFINLQAEVRFNSLFFGLSPVWIINRHVPSKNVDRGYRLDIMTGLKF